LSFGGPVGPRVLELNASQGQVSNSLLSRIDFKDECVDNCVVVAAVANLATDSATSTVCASHLPRQTTKWLAYGCHTSVLLVDWCVPFLVLFQLCDVPQTLNIQHSHPSSDFLHGRRLMNKDVAALAGVLDFALLCLCCRSFSLSALLS